jgi:hypothetical protein
MGLEIVLGFAFYFLPSIVGLVRGARDIVAIMLINLLFGWTVIGWIGTLIWSLIGAKRNDVYQRYLQYPMPPVQPPAYPSYQPYPTNQQYLPPPQPYAPPQQYLPQPPQANIPTPPPQFAQLPIDVEARLKALDGLRAAGLISEAEYQEKRYQILARI